MNEPIPTPTLRPCRDEDEIAFCADLMAGSEPWLTLGRSRQDCLRLFRDPAREAYAVLVGEELVGLLVLVMQGAFTGYIQSVAIKPEWRNRGLGSHVLRFAEERIFSDSPNVFMCVSSFNEDARRLYLRLGYEVVGELKDYIVPGHGEILLRKTIGPLAKFGTAGKP